MASRAIFSLPSMLDVRLSSFVPMISMTLLWCPDGLLSTRPLMYSLALAMETVVRNMRREQRKTRSGDVVFCVEGER